jgi:hypothetical protein
LATAKQVIRDRQLPVIYRINWSGGGSHFFLATDVANVSGSETLGILDPHHAWACQSVAGDSAPYSRIQCAVGALGHRIDLTDYSGEFPFIYLERTSQPRTPSLPFNSIGAEMLLADAQGRRVGYDRATGTILNEIPYAIYYDAQLVPPGAQASGPVRRSLFLPEGAGVAYTLQTIGAPATSGAARLSEANVFQVEIVSTDSQFASAETSVSGSLSPGQQATFHVEITPGQSVIVNGGKKLYLPLIQRK